MRPIQTLCVVYDADCGLCSRVKAWLSVQVQLVPLEFAGARSQEALGRFPWLPAGELAVVADTGEAWLGNAAWVVCLWALRDYRAWSLRLSSPLLLLMAREAFSLLSENRAGVSQWLGLRGDRELERELRTVAVLSCAQTPAQPPAHPPALTRPTPAS